MHPRALAFALLGFLASIAAAASVANFAAGKLEDASLRMSKTALIAAGQNWAGVRTNGTIVYLSGTAPDEKNRILAFDAISNVVSISRIRNQMAVAEAIPAIIPDFSLEILRSGTDVSLIGITPSEGKADIIAEAIAKISGVSLINMKENTDWDAPEGWNSALEFGAEIMGQMERAKISIQPGVVSVTAVVKSDAEKSLLRDALRRLRPDDINLGMDISAPRPIFSPYTLTYIIGENDSALLCHALTLEGATDISNAANKDTVHCEIGLGAPTKNWADVAMAGITAVREMAGGRIEIQDSDITLTAPLDFDEAEFTSITTALKDSLSDAYLLRTNQPKTEIIIDEQRPFFNATLTTQGDVEIDGVVIDDISKTTLQNYSQAKFGFETLTDTTKIAEFAPVGWTSRQLVALDVLAFLNEGRITVTEDTVSVRGKGQVLNLADEIQTLLASGFGADAKFAIEVEEIPLPPTEPVFPDETVCVDEITEMVSNTPIIFAPSSAKIAGESEAMISQIALILNRCRHAVFEISGHTDSQGREEMNKNLSQHRADSVLDALLARNLLLGEIVAIGYGESQPIDDNETEEGREANRRIVFSLREFMPVSTEVYRNDPDVTVVEESPISRPENLVILDEIPEETDGQN